MTTQYEFQTMLYRTSRAMHIAMAAAWVGSTGPRADWLAALRDYTDQALAREAIEAWGLHEHPDFSELELLEAFAEVRANFDQHFPPEHGFKIGDRVEGGKGDDHDTGVVLGYLDPPLGQCDLWIGWKSGVQAEAASSDLTLMNGD